MISAVLRSIRGSSEQIINNVPDQIGGSKQIHSFLKSLPADKLWKGVTSVSNAGRKRGRGKSVRKMMGRNMNVGQTIGVGPANIQWPGLTTSVLKGKDLIRPAVLPPDPERSDRLVKLRDSVRSFRSLRIKSDERGWSGGKTHGKSLGHPDPIGEETFEDFNSVCMKLESVRKMTSHFGRMRFVRGIVFIGNGKGLGGFASVTGTDSQVVLKTAKNRALKKLIPIKFCENRTVFHDFCTEFDHTRIFVYKRPEGFGLVCHRAIRSMCQMIGIKDLYAKIEGSKNVRNIINAFMAGLLKQKTYEEIAEEKRLHLVEMSKESFYYPVVKASPNSCRTESEIEKDEILDYYQYCHGGKVILKRKKYVPFYKKIDSWTNRLRKLERQRNKDEVRKTLTLQYGDVQSFYADKYPEANASYALNEYRKSKMQSKSDDAE